MDPDTIRQPPLIIAHRGASGHAPENSLEAFRLAAQLGADGVELDVHATSDGEIVVFHDEVIPGIGPIREAPVERVRQARLPNGEPIPLLSEVLDAIPALDIWIEVKGLDDRWDASLLGAIERAVRPDRC
ncbi:MAG: glycerophosphodiester phosphodiesterase family protein, partial [Gemmatimonadota bacterium]|nr:glycerophosphodiester phosphodiesterase family protein [Gemmatimonadota bacterium]